MDSIETIVKSLKLGDPVEIVFNNDVRTVGYFSRQGKNCFYFLYVGKKDNFPVYNENELSFDYPAYFDHIRSINRLIPDTKRD
ncbi:MAG: hypothetical protein RL557_351 [archaeon]|jgi:hypothetical protein